MFWQTVLDVIDAVESWVAGQSYWVQVLLLLGVLGPLCYLVAGFIDRLVEAVLAWHSRRDPISTRSPAAAGPDVPVPPTAAAAEPTRRATTATAGE